MRSLRRWRFLQHGDVLACGMTRRTDEELADRKWDGLRLRFTNLGEDEDGSPLILQVFNNGTWESIGRFHFFHYGCGHEVVVSEFTFNIIKPNFLTRSCPDCPHDAYGFGW